jgi:cytochrome c5
MKKLVIAVSALGLMAASSAVLADGQQTFQQACAACHGTGVAGAPKVGDKAAWKDRIAQGSAKLHEHAIKGFTGKAGVMPAKGGRADLSDDVVKAAVDYMVSQSK